MAELAQPKISVTFDTGPVRRRVRALRSVVRDADKALAQFEGQLNELEAMAGPLAELGIRLEVQR